MFSDGEVSSPARSPDRLLRRNRDQESECASPTPLVRKGTNAAMRSNSRSSLGKRFQRSNTGATMMGRSRHVSTHTTRTHGSNAMQRQRGLASIHQGTRSLNSVHQATPLNRAKTNGFGSTMSTPSAMIDHISSQPRNEGSQEKSLFDKIRLKTGEDEDEAFLPGEERLAKATSGPALFSMLMNTEKMVNNDVRKTGADIRMLKRVILDDEFMQRTCRLIPLTLLFTGLFMIFFQLHYTTGYVFLQEQNIRSTFTDAAAEVSTVGDVFDWMHGTMVPALWSSSNVDVTGSDISSMGSNILVGGITLRTAQGPEVACQPPFAEWEGDERPCFPAASLGGAEDQRIISKDSKFNGWESLQDTSSLVRRLRAEAGRAADLEPDEPTLEERFAEWRNLADQRLPLSRRRLEGNWIRGLLSRGDSMDESSGEEEEAEGFEPRELSAAEQARPTKKTSRVIGKDAPPRRVSGPLSNMARRGKKRTPPSSLGRRLKTATSDQQLSTLPESDGTFNVYQKVLPISMTQAEVQSKLSEWAKATDAGTELLSKSTLFFTVEAILKNDVIANGLTTQVFVHFLFSRGGTIYSVVDMHSMPQKNSLTALGALFLWVVLMLGFTFNTPFQAFIAFKSGACMSHFLRFSNFFEWVTLLLGWTILAMFAQERLLNQQFLAEYDDYMQLREGADLRTLVEFDESWLRRFSYKVRRYGLLDSYLVVAVAMYHLVLIFRFLVASRGQKRLAIVVDTIAQGIQDIMHLTVVLLLMVLAYVFSGHILFGARMQELSTIAGAWGYVFQIVGQREYQWDDLIAGHNSFVVMLWLWSLFLVVILVVLNMVLAMIFDNYGEVRMRVTDKDTIWDTGKRIFTQLQQLSSWVPNRHLLVALQRCQKMFQEDLVNVARLKQLCPGIPDTQVQLLFEQCQNKLITTVLRGNKNMLPEAIASILLNVEELRKGVHMMKDWRNVAATYDSTFEVSDEFSLKEKESGSLKISPRRTDKVPSLTDVSPLITTYGNTQDEQDHPPTPRESEKPSWDGSNGNGKGKPADDNVLGFDLDKPTTAPNSPGGPQGQEDRPSGNVPPEEPPFWIKGGLLGHLRTSAQRMDTMYVDIRQIEAALKGFGVCGSPVPVSEPREPSRQLRRESKMYQPDSAQVIKLRRGSQESRFTVGSMLSVDAKVVNKQVPRASLAKMTPNGLLHRA